MRYGTPFPLRILALIGLSALVGIQQVATARGEEAAAKEPPAAEAADQPAEPAPAETAPAEPAPDEKPSAEPTPAETPPAEAAPAEAPPTEAIPAEGAPAEAEPEKPDFDKLAEVEVADRLKLGPDQRERISELLEERKEKLAAAPEATEEQRQAILDETEKKLIDVLTEVQYGDFIGKPVQTRLTFMFRYQPWSEVLDWFAELAGLSLVIPEAPPPGTFNYVDTQEYTPAEAIDLMNRVLIRKGYTLVRRGRMLMVINLEKGIPEGVAPQVEFDRLDKRGEHELVTVRFPIGRRSTETVTEAIKSFTSQYGKVLTVPATQEVVVTDMAGLMPQVSRIIESLPEPKAPPPTPEPPKPQSPELRVYSVKVADPETALSVLTQMIQTATFVLDPDTKRINANATPSQHSLVESVLEKMEEEIPEEEKRVLEVYPIEEFLGVDPSAATPVARIFSRRKSYLPNGSGEALQATLQKIAPEAELSINPVAKTLVVWATPTDQEKIAAALEKLRVDLGPEETPQFETYRLTKVDPDATLTLMETLLPDARLTVDTRTRTLIAVARPADQEVISRTLKTLQPEEPGPDAPELRFYELALAMPPSLLDVVQKVAPGATVAMDASGERLMAVATPAEHGKIEKTIEHMKKTTFIQGRSNLEFYPVTPAQRKRFQAVLDSVTSQLPGIKVILDAQPGELAVWAKPQQHEVLQEILDELKKDVAEAAQYQLLGYPIRSADPPSVLEMLQQLFPHTKLVLDPKTNRLLAWTSPAEHESIKASLEQLAAEPSAEDQPQFHTYPILGVDLQAAGGSLFLTELQTLIPGARLTTDARTNKLIAYATPKEHELIKAALATLEVGGTPETTPTVEVYPLTQADSSATVTLLQTLVPDAQLTVGVKGDRLIARAVAADHETIEATLEKLEPEEPGPDAPQLQFYPFRKEPSASLLTILENLAPKAEITVDPDEKRLIVMARPSEHERIKATIEKFTEGAAAKEPQLLVYPIKTIDGSSVVALLATLAPDAQVSIESQTGNLVALAYPDEHQIIQDTLDQLQPETPGPDTPKLQLHPIPEQMPADLLTVLGKLVPQAQITLDAENQRLMVVAAPTDHDTIRATVEQFETSASRLPELRFLPLVQELPADVLTLLGTLAPKAQITLDAENKRLMVVASAEDYEVIRSTVDEYEATTPLEERSRLAVYPVTAAQRKRFELLQPTLAEEMPGMKVVGEPAPGELAIWAKPTEHMLLAGIMDQLEAEVPETQRRKLVGYTIRSADPNSVLEMLQNLYPDTEFVLDVRANRLLVLTRPDEHESIKSSLAEIEAAGAPEEQPRFDRFFLSTSDAATIVSTLQPLVPNARLTVDARTRQLIAWGTPTELEIIRTAVERLQSDTGAQAKPALKVYRLKKADPQTTLTLLQSLVPGVELTLEPQSKRLIVNAMPAEHDQIKATLEMIEIEAPAEDQPRFATYPIAGPATAETGSTFVAALQPLVPEAKLTFDVKTRKLIALATPEEQEIIGKAVESMEAGSGDQLPQFHTYPIYGADSAAAAAGTFVTSLQPLVPDAKLTVDTKGKKLIVFGTPDEHELVRKAMESMGRGGDSPETTPQLEVYRLTRADPNSVLALLETLLPDAQFSIDVKTNSLAALAVPADQAAIKATLDQLQPEKPGPDSPQLLFHVLGREPSDELLAAIQPLVPRAQLTLDTENDRIMAVATPAEHEIIRSTIDQFEASTPPDEPNKLIVYPVTSAQKARLQAIVTTLTEEFPGIQVIADEAPDEVAVWAKPTQHVALAEIIEQLKGELSEGQRRQLVPYRIKSADPSSVLTVMQDLFPEVKFVLEPNTNRLLVWTRPEEHESIKASLEKIEAAGPPEDQPRFQTYPIYGSGTAAVAGTFVATLQPLVPNARLSLDANGRKLIAWGTPEEHEIIGKAMEQLGRGGDSLETTPQLEVYQLTKADPASTLALLQNLLPDAQLNIDAQTNSLVALAIPDDQAAIKATLEQLQPEQPGPNTPVLQFHPLLRKPGDNLLAVLQPLVPKAQITVDTENDRVMAVATPADHQTIKSAIDQFEASTPPEEPGKLQVYRVTASQRKRFEALLPKLAEEMPGVQIIGEGEAGEVAVWAKPTQHLVLAEIIQELKGDADEDQQFRLGVYPIRSADPESVLAVLQRLFPDDEFIVDDKTRQIMVWTSAAEQQKIQSAIEAMDTGVPGEWEEQVGVYPVPNVDPAAAIEFLQQLLPDSRFITDTKRNAIVAWGPKSDHDLITQTLEQMSAEGPPEMAPTARAYTLESITPAAAAEILAQAAPEAKITIGPGDDQLAVWASPKDHKIIENALSAIDVESPTAKDADAVIYALEGMSRTGTIYALSFLRDTIPEARFAAGAQEGQIVAWATPEVHGQIASLVEQLTREAPEKAHRIAVYPLQSTTATNAMQVLSTAVPQANVTLDTNDPQKLTVWARPSEHETVRAILEKIDVEGREEAEPVIYALEGMTASSASYVLVFLNRAVPNAEFIQGVDPTQVIAWARPEDHERIAQLIERLTTEPPEKARQAGVYNLESITAASATPVLQQAVPQATFVPDSADAQKLTVWARPSEHETIAEILEEIDVQGAATAVSKLRIYTIEGMTAYGALTILQAQVPRARISLGTDPQQLVVWARPADHEQIDQIVGEITAVATEGEAARVARVYTLESLTATAATTFLQQVAPQAQILPGAQPDQLMVWARPQDHERIDVTLKQIDVEGPEDATVAIYTLEGMDSRSTYYVSRFLRETIPEARFVPGMDPSQLVAWARPKDHEAIQKLIDQMTAGPPPEKARRATVYNLKWIKGISASRVLQSAVPNATVTSDVTDPQRLTVFASPAEHETVEQILQEIDAEGPPETASTVKVYPVEGMTAPALYTILRTEVPQARVSYGTDRQELIVWARPADHEQIRQLIDEIAAVAAEGAAARVAQVYTLESLTATAATTFLRQVVPQAQVSPGAQPDQLIVWARAQDHEKIDSTLKQIDVEGPDDATPAIYVLEGMDSRGALYATIFLRNTFPEAQFAQGADPTQVVAWARPKDHEDIQALVDQLTAEPPPEKAPQAVVYQLESITAESATEVLQAAVPQATLTVDAVDPQRLTALARPVEHKIIAGILDEIDVEGSPESAVKVVSYPLPGVESRRAYYAMSFIRDAVPEATVTLNTDSTQLIAWARPKDHKRIAELIEQVLRERPELARKMAVYALKWTTAATAMEILEEAVRGADFSVGDDPQQLIVWARPAEHEVIETTLREIDLEPSPETTTGAVVYTLKSISPDEATQILQQAVPKASFTADEDSQTLTALARPADHEMIQRILEEIDVEGPADAASSAIVYTLEYVTPATAIEVLESAVPDAQFTENSEPNQVVAWARPRDHEIIDRTLKTIDVEGPADKIARAEVYPLEGMDIRRAVYALRFLNDAVPEAEFTLSADGSQLIAFAVPKDHEILEGLVKQLTEESPELARKAEAYDLKHATAADAIQALAEAVPDASLSPGATENQVVAWARPDDHRKIVEMLEQLDREPPPETEPTAKAYSLEAADPTEAIRILREAVPQARVTIGAEPHQLIAWARPADHEIIDQIIQKIVEQGPDELAPRVMVYTLETTDAEGAIAFLRAAVPDAELSIGTDPRRLIAWARPRDHEIIDKAVQAMSEKESPETAPKVAAYTLKTTDATTAIEILQEAVPDARFAVGSDTRQLLAWARPADHEIIGEAVEKMSQEEPIETRPYVEVYDLESTGATNAIQVLQAAVPEARLGVGNDPGKLVAWARPEDHEIIAAAVEQFEADSWLEGKRIISVYPIKAGDPQSLIDMLEPELEDRARFVVDADRNSLIVWADAKHHEMIDKTVREFIEGLESTPEMSTVVYRFQLADPSAVLSVLQSLVPRAQLALDTNTQSIVAGALAEDHEKIKATIDEMEREDVEGQRPMLRVHRVTTGRASNVLGSLYALFRQDPTVQLSLDSTGESIVAIASPIKHEKIEQLIQEVEKGVLLDSANVLELYSMKNVDTASAMEILDRLMEKRGAKADLSLDSRSNQLVAIARPDHHELIKETLEQLRREEPDLEIYDLEYVDPLSAEMAILSEFEDEGLNAPQVDIDPVTQQLFVRANEEQQRRIRQLLIKMGEIKLQLLGDRGTEAMRVIPFHGDLESAIEEIKRAWPELGERIRVVTPSSTLPDAAPGEPKPAEAPPKDAPPAKTQAKPAEPAPKETPPAKTQPRPAEAKPEEKPAATPPGDSAMDEAWQIFAAIELGSPSEDDQGDQPSPTDSAEEPISDESPAPIYVVVGEGSVTLVSDDPEALDQVERLLRALLPSTGTIGRNISIFELKHSKADAVAEKLEELFTASPFSWRRGVGSVVIVPDERLNTILVQGSRIDRETVEGLLTILDSDKVPEALAADKPNLVPIENVDAEQIAEVIRSVFKSQMTPPTTSSRSPSRRVSTRLRVPQVAVDEGTNSLLVMAESPLLEEIIQLAEKLDEAAGENPARRIRIIPLEKTDAGRVQKALEQILNGGSSRRGR